MKARMVLALLYGVGAASFLMSMELSFNFIVDNSESIAPYSQQNHNPFNRMPLKKKDHGEVALELSKAVKKHNTIEIPCEVDTMNFLAKIKELEKKDKIYNYFIECDNFFDFTINKSERVMVYSKQQLPFDLKLCDVEKQDTIEALYLDEQNEQAIIEGCLRALETQESVTVPYVLKNAHTLEVELLIAKITAFKSRDNFSNYFIKIKEVKK